MTACKQLLAELVDSSPGPETARHTALAIARVRAGEEARRGISAFLEGRRPDWDPS